MDTLTAAFSTNNIPVVFSSNDNFAIYLGVAIKSLIENSSATNNYDIVILQQDLTEPSQDKLKSLVTGYPNVSLRFVNISPYLQNLRDNTFYLNGYVPIETYYKFFLPAILPAYDKCIYLDSDIVVLDDIARLFSIDLKDKAIGASLNVAIIYYVLNKSRQIIIGNYTWQEYMQRCLKLKKPAQYFQAGVLLWNLKKIRTMDFTNRCLARLAEIKTPRFFDQCVLNSLLQGEVVFFSTAWNHVWYFRESSFLKGKIANELYDDYAQGRQNPKIIHYAGEKKAHHDPEHVLANYFWQYARLCPFYGEILMAYMVYCRQQEKDRRTQLP